MSLRVWLPLNGNLNNQGISDVTASGTLTYSNSGKIGKCVNVDSGHILTIPYSSGELYDFSFSFWIKIPTAMSSNTAWESMMSFSAINTANSTTINTINMNYADYHQVKIYDDSSHQHNWRTPTYDVWEHWTIVHHSTPSSSNIKFYINGILNGSYDTSHPLILQNGNITFGNSVTVGSFALNDFRLYDHYLSPKEVKEISKGLCLHYRLSGPGQENLFTHTSPDEKKSSDEWMQIGNDTTSIFDQYGLVPYTVSFEAKSEIAGDFMLYSTSGSNPKYSWTKTTINLTTDWQYFTYTFTPTLNASDGTWSRISIYGTYDTGKIPSIRNAKLELGNIATPWIPNSSDSDYFKMRYDNNIEYDCSGYCRNGTKSGTITWDADSPRYTTSYQLTTANIVGPIPNTLKPAESITIAMWVRLASERTSGELALFNNYEGGGAGLDINGTSYGMQIYSGEYKGAWVDMAGKMTQWHHFAGTFDGNNIKTYIDGELKATVAVTAGSTISYHPDTPWSIGINPGPSGGSGGMIGNVSDARIYATALSAEDILELYNSPINIDNGNNLYAYEFIEEEENNFSKQGIVKNSEFIDLDTAGDSYINASISSTVDYANIFIEK